MGGASLTGRQLECLRWAAEGKTTAEIALILSLSEDTVGHHFRIAQERLGAANRVQAVAIAIRGDMI